MLAVKAVGDAVDPWEKAVKIEHWVARNLKDKNFKTAFAPASEVARNLSGDCTEHGVLVAAMCRAPESRRGWPSAWSTPITWGLRLPPLERGPRESALGRDRRGVRPVDR